ncbi:hypothetical protein ACXET9_12740 [Brachybacterium sp. DNPG3]
MAAAGHPVGCPAVTPPADAIFLLVEGCMATAGLEGDAGSAVQAKDAAARLLAL